MSAESTQQEKLTILIEGLFTEKAKKPFKRALALQAEINEALAIAARRIARPVMLRELVMAQGFRRMTW